MHPSGDVQGSVSWLKGHRERSSACPGGPGRRLLPSPSVVIPSSNEAQLCPLCTPHSPATSRRCESRGRWLAVLWVTEGRTQVAGGQLEERLSRLRELGRSAGPPSRGVGGHVGLLGCPVVRGGRGDGRPLEDPESFPFRGRLTKRHQEADLSSPRPCPQPTISGSSAGSEPFCTVILREGGERPWERTLFNFLFAPGFSSAFKGDFLSHFCDALFRFPEGRGGGLGAESWGL